VPSISAPIYVNAMNNFYVMHLCGHRYEYYQLGRSVLALPLRRADM
jgi:hypothetical protein